MASIIIDGHTATNSFENSGDMYHFDPAPVLAISGNGTPVVAPYAVLTIHWSLMLDADMTWIITTVMEGAASLECTGTTKFYDHTKTLQTYSHCRLYRPTYATFKYGYYTDVTLRVSEIT